MDSSFKIINTYPHEKQRYQLEYRADVDFLLALMFGILFISKIT